MQNITSRIKHLQELITYHNNLYWNLNKPEISDKAYDLLMQELKEKSPNDPLLSYVGGIVTKLKVTHKYRMLSLAKIYTYNDLITWLNKVSRSDSERFIIEPKYDGISVSLHNAVLSTRGNGSVGEDISRHLPYIQVEYNAPLISETYLRGELLVKKSTFKHLDSKYKTERNMAAGLANNKIIEEKHQQCLTLVDFDLHKTLLTFKEIKNIKDFDSFVSAYENLDYPTDGVVFKLADKDYADTFNTTAHHSNSEISLKFTNTQATSKLLSVQFQSGKRKLTPVAIIEPVIINGVTIERVTLHNYGFILERGLCIGDKLVIERAGDVIPHVLDNIGTETATLISCSKCPYCGFATKFIDPDLFCTNDNCPGKASKLLYDSICRIGIKNIGQATTNKLMDILNCKNIVDILLIKQSDIDILINTTDSGFKEKSGQNLFNEIKKVIHFSVSDWQVLSALNIKGFSATLSKKVLYGRTISELMCCTFEELCIIEGISKDRASVLIKGLVQNENLVCSLIQLLTIKEDSKAKIAQNKETFVLTGKFTVPKKQIIKEIEAQGFNVSKTLTKKTDYLVSAGKESSKTKKATKLNIPILNYADLTEYLNM